MTPAAWANDLTIAYGAAPALSDLSWEAEYGQQWWIVGPNGGGKSSFLRAVAGLLRPSRGSAGRSGSVAYVAQRETINWRFPARVRDVVAFGCLTGPWWRKQLPPHHRMLIPSCLERAGLAGLADRPLGELSGGEQQRVILARALATDAAVYLFDEPAKGLDRTSEAIFSAVVSSLSGDGRLVVTVTHDLGRVARSEGCFLGLSGCEVARGPSHTVLEPGVLERLFAGAGRE